MRRVSVLILLVLAPAAALLSASAGTAPPEPALRSGPGQVLEMHKDLFAALDRGDLRTAHTFFAKVPSGATWTEADGWGEPRGFLAFGTDAKGHPLEANNPSDGLKSLMQLLVEDGKQNGWTTRIT